jgi:DNA polymerase/3'-5' exonuclease PolX
MGSGPRFPRKLIDPIVADLIELFGLDRIAVCGSYRRGNRTVGDIDVVLTGVDTEEALDLLRQRGLRLHEPGSPRDHLHMPVPWTSSPISVDVWTPLPGMVGACLMHATGPGMHNAIMRRWAFARGYSVTWRGVQRLSDGEWVAGATEAEVCEAVGWPYATPEHRERFYEWVGPYLEILNDMETAD